MLSLSVLFHQSYIFWFLVFFFQHLKLKKYLLPISSGLFVSLIYIISAKISDASSLFSFVIHDVEAGLVETDIGIQHFVFTLINGIRTLLQIHGSMLVVLNQHFWLAALGMFGLILFLGTVVVWLKNSLLRSSKQTAESSDKLQKNPPLKSIFKDPLFWAFILQLGFAFYSVGNAEFMIMLLPQLVILWTTYHQLPFETSATKLHLAALGLGLYHLVFVIIPLFSSGSSPVEEIGRTLITTSQTHSTQQSSHNGSLLFLSNDAKSIENFVEYTCRLKNQKTPEKNIYIIASSQKSIKEIQTYRNQKTLQIITDESYLNQNPKQFNRAQLLQEPLVVDWFMAQKWQTWQTVALGNGLPPAKLYCLVQ